MKLPEGERAVVSLDKLRNYSLNPLHSRGRHKARVFASALGIFQSDAKWLQMKLLEAAVRFDAIEAEADDYGRRYTLDFNCEKAEKRSILRSGWIIRRSEDFPRLTTCYVVLE